MDKVVWTETKNYKPGIIVHNEVKLNINDVHKGIG